MILLKNSEKNAFFVKKWAKILKKLLKMIVLYAKIISIHVKEGMI